MKIQRCLLTLSMGLVGLGLQAKSIVLTLNDTKGTQVYYKITTDAPPRMIIADDGTFTMNGTEYEFAGVKNFRISDTDYSGAANTVDAIASVNENQLTMQGDVRIYSLDGRLVSRGENGANMAGLKAGTYVITNGVSTLKISKK